MVGLAGVPSLHTKKIACDSPYKLDTKPSPSSCPDTFWTDNNDARKERCEPLSGGTSAAAMLRRLVRRYSQEQDGVVDGADGGSRVGDPVKTSEAVGDATHAFQSGNGGGDGGFSISRKDVVQMEMELEREEAEVCKGIFLGFSSLLSFMFQRRWIIDILLLTRSKWPVKLCHCDTRT